MKGKLIKDDEGWWVQHKAKGLDGNQEYIAESMLHPDDVKQIEEDAKVFDNIEARIAAYPDVEFEMVTEVVASIGDSEEQDEYTVSYAKLIPSKEPSYELEYNCYMKTFVNSNLTPPTIEEFVNKVNTDSDFASYWGPKGKEIQKRLITEIMELDAKDGLYDTVYDTVKKLAEKSWEGCDGCDENDKNFWINGFRAGYNTAKPDKISDEEIENAANEHNRKGYFISPSSFVEGAKWYRKQLKKQ
jgi:hypothetical protein